MVKFVFSLLFAGLLFTAQASSAASLSANDFLPPVQAGSPEAESAAEKIQAPDAIKKEKGIDGQDAVVAATAQDAINAAVKDMETGPGCRQIKFPSGFGWVATGVGVYKAMPNPVATLTAQRQAYQIAYLNAKKTLAETLYGLSSEGREQLKQEFSNVISDTDTLTNADENLKEDINEQVRGFLRGFVVYSVNDKQEKDSGVVTVSIVATPKTMGKGQKISGSTVTADSINEGLNAVLAELGNGLMPPVGGTLISVPHTGEMAFIGFGSAVIIPDSNSAMQAKQKLQAQKLATMRARNALCGIILGTDIQGNSSLDSTTATMSKQFEEIEKEDPVNKASKSVEIQKLAEQKESFLNRQVSKEQIASMSKGILPPGVKVKTFFNGQDTMVDAVAVYLPSLSANAAADGEDMKNSRIVQDGKEAAKSSMPAQGASGQVTPDGNL